MLVEEYFDSWFFLHLILIFSIGFLYSEILKVLGEEDE